MLNPLAPRLSTGVKPLSTMQQIEHRGWLWGKCALAVLLALIFLGIIIPNTGRIVIDHTTTPPTPHVVGRLSGVLLALSFAAVSLGLVLIGTFRRSQVSVVGWILLVLLVVLSLSK